MSVARFDWSESLIDRFWAKVDRTDACWLWKGARTANGYGNFRVGQTNQYAHRVAYAIHHHRRLTTLAILHRCDVRLCVNPEHLFVGTIADNNADTHSKGREARGAKITLNRKTTILKPEDVAQIWAERDQLRGNVRRIAQVAHRYGVSVLTIRGILNGYRWAWYTKDLD